MASGNAGGLIVTPSKRVIHHEPPKVAGPRQGWAAVPRGS